MTEAPDIEEAPNFKEAWTRLVERTIGAPLETLRSRSFEGVSLEPLYRRPKASEGQPWRTGQAWTLAQRLDHPDPDAANRLALADLEGGTDALVLVDAASPFARGFGFSGDHDLALEGVELDLIQLRLDAGPAAARRATDLAELARCRRLTSAALDIDIAYDPIGCGARLGRDLADDTAAILDLRAAAGFGGTALLADGRPWHEAGAGEAQELAAVLAVALAHLRRLEKLGIPPGEGRRLIAVLLSVDADILLGLAKVRAMRRLWARVETASGLEPVPLRLHAETSWRMMTRHDPWTNVMRTTAAAFAASLGGADAITVLPFTLPLGLPDAAARRLARNTHHLMRDEAHLAKVADPAAGAGAFEALTETLCRTAWTLFQEVEREGGLPLALPVLRSRIAEAAAARAAAIGTLTQGIVGTSRFASLEAPGVEVLAAAPRPTAAASDEALPARRDAEPFEALRDRAEQCAAAGRGPFVFLATLGPPADFGPNATYAANFFAAAGLSSVTQDADAEDVDAIASSFIKSGSRVACLCGTAKAYKIDAAALAGALRAAGARLILVCKPDDDGLPADIDAAIHDGCDALQILEKALDAATSGL